MLHCYRLKNPMSHVIGSYYLRKEKHSVQHRANWLWRDQSSTNQLRSIEFFTNSSHLNSPPQGVPRVKAEELQQGDPLVINTIQLLAHKRALDKLLDMVETYKTAITSGELERMPPLAPPPHMPEVVPVIRFLNCCLTNLKTTHYDDTLQTGLIQTTITLDHQKLLLM